MFYRVVYYDYGKDNLTRYINFSDPFNTIDEAKIFLLAIQKYIESCFIVVSYSENVLTFKII